MLVCNAMPYCTVQGIDNICNWMGQHTPFILNMYKQYAKKMHCIALHYTQYITLLKKTAQARF